MLAIRQWWWLNATAPHLLLLLQLPKPGQAFAGHYSLPGLDGHLDDAAAAAVAKLLDWNVADVRPQYLLQHVDEVNAFPDLNVADVRCCCSQDLYAGDVTTLLQNLHVGVIVVIVRLDFG